MWDLTGPGIEPVSLALQGRFLTTGPPGKPSPQYLCCTHYVGHASRYWECSDELVLALVVLTFCWERHIINKQIDILLVTSGVKCCEETWRRKRMGGLSEGVTLGRTWLKYLGKECCSMRTQQVCVSGVQSRAMGRYKQERVRICYFGGCIQEAWQMNLFFSYSNLGILLTWPNLNWYSCSWVSDVGCLWTMYLLPRF